MAHELRSPLTGIKGFTATLLAKWDRFTEDQRRLMLEAVDSDADRLTRLIAELLDVARIDAGRLELRRVPTDLAALVRKRVEAQDRRRGRRRPLRRGASPTTCPRCGSTPTRWGRCSTT